MEKILYKELSYKLNGIFFKVHNKWGRFLKEKKYADEIEKVFMESKIKYRREYSIDRGNRADFIVENSILIDLKAKRLLEKNDYYQMLRYLKLSGLKLGLVVNFRNTYLKPRRIINNS